MTTKKKSMLLMVVGIVILTLIAVMVIQLHASYDRDWILGKSRAQITARYGQFDQSILGNGKEVYLIKDSPLAPIYDGSKGYLVLEFNTDGKCSQVYDYQPPGL